MKVPAKLPPDNKYIRQELALILYQSSTTEQRKQLEIVGEFFNDFIEEAVFVLKTKIAIMKLVSNIILSQDEKHNNMHNMYVSEFQKYNRYYRVYAQDQIGSVIFHIENIKTGLHRLQSDGFISNLLKGDTDKLLIAARRAKELMDKYCNEVNDDYHGVPTIKQETED